MVKLLAAAAALLLASTAALANPPRTKPTTPPKKAPTLAVTALEPNSGDAEGGTYVRVRGRGFIDVAAGKAFKIYFGSHQGTVVRIADDTQLIAEAPGGKVGDKVDVLLVIEGGGEIKLEKGFTFIEPKQKAPTTK